MREDVYLDEEMEMPCRCECGVWFDLEQGKQVPGTNVLYCIDCSKKKTNEYYEDFR